MIFLVTLVGLPIAYLALLVTRLARRDARGIGFGRYRSSAQRGKKLLAWAAFAAVLFLGAYVISDGLKTKTKNRIRDDRQAAHSAQIARDRDTIAAALKANPGRERAWLDSAIRARMGDGAFLLAALPNDSISPALLDTLANSADLNIAFEAVANTSTRAETLERVYRTKSYPDYFFQPLAAHHHTPPGVLLELYRRPRTIMNLDIWFAGNPAAPKEILGDIAQTASDRSVIAALLENPSLDCGTLSQLAVNLMKRQNRDADNPNVARLNELLPKVCRNTTQ